MPVDISDEEETSTESNSGILLHHYEEDNIPYVAEEYEINTSHDRSEGVKHVKKVECVTNPPFLDHVYAAGTSPGSTDVNVHDTAVQTDMTMNDINIMSDQIHQLQAKLDDKTTLLRDCFIETVTKNDENVKLYTGLPSLAIGYFQYFICQVFCIKILVRSTQCPGEKLPEEQTWKTWSIKKIIFLSGIYSFTCSLTFRII